MQHQAEFQTLRQTLAETIIGQPALLDRFLLHVLLALQPFLLWLSAWLRTWRNSTRDSWCRV